MIQTQRHIVESLATLPHKDEVNPMDWFSMHPSLILIAWSTVNILKIRGAPILFTSLIRKGIPGLSVSKSHIEGRAFDMSIRGMSIDDIDAALEEVNWEHAAKRGAISMRDKVARALIFEHRTDYKAKSNLEKYVVINQADPHLHGQCRA